MVPVANSGAYDTRGGGGLLLDMSWPMPLSVSAIGYFSMHRDQSLKEE